MEEDEILTKTTGVIEKTNMHFILKWTKSLGVLFVLDTGKESQDLGWLV